MALFRKSAISGQTRPDESSAASCRPHETPHKIALWAINIRVSNHQEMPSDLRKHSTNASWGTSTRPTIFFSPVPHFAEVLPGTLSNLYEISSWVHRALPIDPTKPRAWKPAHAPHTGFRGASKTRWRYAFHLPSFEGRLPYQGERKEDSMEEFHAVTLLRVAAAVCSDGSGWLG